MSPLPRTLRLLSLAMLGAVATPLAAVATPAAGPDSTPSAAAAPAPAAEAAPGFTLSGYAEASFTWANKTVGDNTILGRVYDRYSNAFTLNALKVTADRPFDATKVDAGVHADVIVGQNAAVIKSSGFDLGNNGELEQLYITLNAPTSNGNGVQFKIGKMVTLLGLEVIEDVANPVWSEGNQFAYVENFTSTGMELDLKLSSAVDVELRVDNGWDRLEVTDGQKSFMGRVGLAGGNTSLGIVGYYGEQEPNTGAARYGVDVLLNQKAGKTSFWVQGDYGMEKMNAFLADPTQDASWWAIGFWLAADMSAKANFALRADYLDDTQGARTSGVFGTTPGEAHKLWSLTGTLTSKKWENVLARTEVRYDHSNFPVFDGESGQYSIAISYAYIF